MQDLGRESDKERVTGARFSELDEEAIGEKFFLYSPITQIDLIFTTPGWALLGSDTTRYNRYRQKRKPLLGCWIGRTVVGTSGFTA